jgi:hypothetical protein
MNSGAKKVPGTIFRGENLGDGSKAARREKWFLTPFSLPKSHFPFRLERILKNRYSLRRSGLVVSREKNDVYISNRNESDSPGAAAGGGF